MIAQVRQVQLALLLAESGVRFVIVGGTARLLRGAPHVPADLDIVVSREAAVQLTAALQHDAARGLSQRSVGAGPWRVVTSWSPVDVFVEDELPPWHTVEVDGTELRVADD